MKLKIAAVFLSLTAGSMLAAGAALAEDRDDVGASVTVRYSRAELATSQGTERLYARLMVAAHQACPDSGSRDPMRTAPERACYETALSEAVAHIQQPRLTALHKRKAARGITASRGA